MSIQPDYCPVCESHDITSFEEFPDPVCASCGTVIREGISTKLPSDSEEKSHPDIRWSDYYSITNSTEQNIANTLEILEDLGTKLNLSLEERKYAVEIYSSAAIENFTDGRPTPLVIAAIVCISCRKNQSPRPCNYIADKAALCATTLQKHVRLLNREVLNEPVWSEPVEFLPHLCQEVGLNKKSERRAATLLNVVEEEAQFGGKHPSSVAASALYLAADGSITQRELARAAGVTTETMRVRLNELRGILKNEPVL